MSRDWIVVSKDPEVQAFYEAMRLSGESHNLAECLALKKFPSFTSDDIFIKGTLCSDRGKVGPEELWLKQKAEAVGVSTTGKMYMRGLADYPGDPTAWVSDSHDVLEVARRKNYSVDGLVKYRAHEVEPMPDVPIDPALVEMEVQALAAEDPGARIEDLREQVTALRSGTADPNPLRVKDYGDDVFTED